ncbi:MAG TPA: GDSL-type esterase/lipase family protein [Tepidisphaeraceae bacterium]|jgi:lysophospholipase L1-like esterase|nr:GDSL-type esterase/lipase family protein [Tepidisphaeraceae bacterium]
MINANRFRAVLFGCLALLIVPAFTRAEIVVKSGEKIAFLGDSITAAGAASPSGYVHLVISGLKANGVNATAIPAGISGHKSNDMLARVQRDVIDKKPDWMTLSCGVNDVWHGANGVPLDQYKKNITEIVDKCEAAHIKVLVLTSTMIHEEPNDNNTKLGGYNDFLRELAKEKKLPVADLNEEMQAAIKAAPKHQGNYLTVDGVHMNALGNVMMATGVLKGFGLDEAQLHTAKEAWLDLPNAVELGKISVSLRQLESLQKLAESRHESVQNLVNAEVKKSVDELLKSEH